MNAHTSVGPLDRAARVYIAGHRGLVGSALLRTFAGAGFTNLLVRSRAELDLTDRAATFDFVLESRPQVVIDAAARVGGILANDTYPADFLSENLQIQVNLLDAAVAARVPRLLFLGSSCIYPKLARSRSRRARCSPVRWSRPTTRTRSPKSPASLRSRRCAANMACRGSRRCPPTCTGQATTFRRPARICCRHSSAAMTRPKPVARPT